MTTLHEAAQQALEAMEIAEVDPHSSDAVYKAIDALRAALAEPVQEPVKFWPLAPLTGYYDVGGKRVWLEKDEPFPAPPQRKPLTEEEIRDLWSWSMTAEAERTATTQQHAFARAIERAHGIGGQDD